MENGLKSSRFKWFNWLRRSRFKWFKVQRVLNGAEMQMVSRSRVQGFKGSMFKVQMASPFKV
jgi:hypothetical protein